MKKYDLASEEDLVSQAGWMYTDLFLALMVIFLATISFVPKLTPLSAQAKTSTTSSITSLSNSLQNLNNGLTFISSDVQKIELQDLVNNFKKKYRLPSDSQIVFVQVVGGFDPNIEKPSSGLNLAMKVSLELKKKYLNLLSQSAFSLDSTSELTTNTFAIRITFSNKFK